MPTTTHHTPGPLDLDIRVQAGRIEIETAATDETTVDIEPLDGGDAGRAAVETARQELRPTGEGHRLVIDIPRRPRLFGWNEPEVCVRVRCPHGAGVIAKTASADVDVRGGVGAVSTKTASGDVTIEAAGDVDVKTASGDISVGLAAGRAGLNTMSGDIVLDQADGAVSAHTMSGDVRAERLTAGTVELRTMSGDIVATVRLGATLWIDASSMSGEVSSDLPVSDSAPTGRPTDIELRASSMSGDIDLRRAEEASTAGA
ncbi:MAG TPA: DUF4097 family beta strand repeat-containing protein [Gaiellales bacterium]|nr:DUF4097 family beta strand repeat-containing protein [Gaiellales bacterium]